MTADENLFVILNHALSGPVSTSFFSAVTWLGNGFVLAALVLVPMLLLDRRRFRMHALALVLCVGVSGVAVNVAKPLVGRERPAIALAERGLDVHVPGSVPRDRSFPSGHTQTAFGTAAYLACVYPPAAPLFLALAALVGLSRIALGVHYPLDVLVGALTGCVVSVAAFRINEWRLHRRRTGSQECVTGGPS